MNEKEVKDLLDKAIQSFNAAKILHKESFYDFSASKAYYAMFYAIEALLLSQNLSFSKHSAVISAFGKNFVKPGFSMKNIIDMPSTPLIYGTSAITAQWIPSQKRNLKN